MKKQRSHKERMLMGTRTRKIRCGSGGFTLVEVMLVTFVLVLTALIFVATFSTSQISRMKAAHMSYATSLAQQKIEEMRAAGYASILITDPVENSLPELPTGTQIVTVTQYAPNIKKIEVTISWGGYRQVGGSITLVTLISDHS